MNVLFGVGSASGAQIGVITLDSIENVVGDSGTDRLIGSSGANRIEGGPGNERLTGSGGLDTFVFKPGFGKETITDFRVGTASNHDTRDLRGLGFSSIADLLSHTDAGASAAIHAGSDTITLQGVTKQQLQSHAHDLLLA